MFVVPEDESELLLAADDHGGAPAGTQRRSTSRASGGWRDPTNAKRADAASVIVGPTLTLITSSVGAGLLTLPWATRKLGIVGCMIVLVVFGTGTAVTDDILVAFTRASLPRNHVAGMVLTYEHLCGRVLGRKAYYVALACVLFNCLGSLIGFLIITSDLALPFVRHLGGHGWLASRPMVLCLFTACVALPLSCLPTVHSLRGSSAVAVATIAFVAVVVCLRGVQAQLGDAPPSLAPPPVSWGVCEGMPVAIFALGNQLQMPPLYSSMPPGAQARSAAIVWLSMAGCVVLYGAVGVLGFAVSGPATPGDILSSRSSGFGDDSNTLTVIVKFVMAAHVSLAYPVVCMPCRDALHLFIAGMTRRRQLVAWQQRGLLLLLVALTVGIAIGLPQVQVVFSLVGSTSGVIVVYILPAAFMLVDPAVPVPLVGFHSSRQARKATAWLLAVVGVVVGAVGTAVTIAGLA